MRRQKYNARGEHRAGRYFGSQGESRRGADLELEQIEGGISGLAFHPVITLAGCVEYRPDYTYTEEPPAYPRQRFVIEDFKGFLGDRFRVICQLWPLWGPAPLKITRADGSVREILPQPQALQAFLRTIGGTHE